MGVDWLIMRPKAECSTDKLHTLVEQQADAAVEYRLHLYAELSTTLPPQSDRERQLALQHFIKSSKELATCLDIINIHTDEFQSYHRVSVISSNAIFPIEWRIHTIRTYLPDDVPVITQQWKSYTEAVWQGGYRAFLLDLFLYLTSHQLRELWEELQFLGIRAVEKGNAFTKKPKFQIVHGRLKAFPPPPAFGPPTWAEVETQKQSIDPDADSRYQELMQYQQNVELLRRDWKHNVSSSLRPMRFKPHTFDEYLQLAIGHKDEFQEFIEWLEACCQRGYGLFLNG